MIYFAVTVFPSVICKKHIEVTLQIIPNQDGEHRGVQDEVIRRIKSFLNGQGHN